MTISRSGLGVLLAAGEGTRMKSAKPKPLHEVAGRSMLAHALAALVEAGCDRIAVVVGPGAGGEALAAAAQAEVPAAGSPPRDFNQLAPNSLRPNGFGITTTAWRPSVPGRASGSNRRVRNWSYPFPRRKLRAYS